MEVTFRCADSEPVLVSSPNGKPVFLAKMV